MLGLFAPLTAHSSAQSSRYKYLPVHDPSELARTRHHSHRACPSQRRLCRASSFKQPSPHSKPDPLVEVNIYISYPWHVCGLHTAKQHQHCQQHKHDIVLECVRQPAALVPSSSSATPSMAFTHPPFFDDRLPNQTAATRAWHCIPKNASATNTSPVHSRSNSSRRTPL